MKKLLEKQVIEVEQFYESTDNIQGNNSKGDSLVKEKGREKYPTGTKKPLQDATHTKVAALSLLSLEFWQKLLKLPPKVQWSTQCLLCGSSPGPNDVNPFLDLYFFLHRLWLGGRSDHGERMSDFYACNRYEEAKHEGVVHHSGARTTTT
ncbi:hypothetical protein VNO80_27293 [Phaseolus coccineus]|uniref:Uncharacterized protein n=1 Tax=Phaseolus coccineus TaxID=3886 RepID=A0AAN9QHD6_PHACN